MAQKTCRRGGERGVSLPALAPTHVDEAPGPGAERAAWSSDLKVAGSRSPTGAVSRGRALETVRCPLCGKLMPKHSAALHAFSHLEALERSGIVKLARESGGWIVMFNDARAYSSSTATTDFRFEVRGLCPETRWARWGRRGWRIRAGLRLGSRPAGGSDRVALLG
jgi:hypothetical protein